MNTITIKNFDDYANKLLIFAQHGKRIDGTRELSPAVIEMNQDAIESVVTGWLKMNGIAEIDFGYVMDEFKEFMKGRRDFTEIEGSEYIASDYDIVNRKFSYYSFERDSRTQYTGRRQFNYHFNEKLCLHGMQIFEDLGTMILNFRSCDYLKKFPLDIYMMAKHCRDRGIEVHKFYCIFGSLHCYDNDFRHTMLKLNMYKAK